MGKRFIVLYFFIIFDDVISRYKNTGSPFSEENLSDQIQSVLAESGCKEVRLILCCVFRIYPLFSLLKVFETMVFKLYQANHQLRLKQSLALPNLSVRSKTASEERVDHIQQVRPQWDQGLLRIIQEFHILIIIAVHFVGRDVGKKRVDIAWFSQCEERSLCLGDDGCELLQESLIPLLTHLLDVIHSLF